MKNIYKKLLLIISISIIFFTGIEIFFGFFFVKSDGFCFTLASKTWFKRYWLPINSLGYRDIEYTKDNLKGKRIVFVVGDSFVAGQGIKNYKDRFSNILQEKLGKSWAVLN